VEQIRQRSVVDILWCPKCRETSPWRCANCGSVDLITSAKGVGKIAAELEGLSGTSVLDGTRGGVESQFHAEIVVGTEALLYEDLTAHAVVFLDIDQFTASSSTDGTLKSLYLLGRALVATSQSGGPVLAITRRPQQQVLEAARRSDVRSLYREELEARAAFGLPPSRRFVLISGVGAVPFLDQTRESFDQGAEFFQLDEGTYVISLPPEAVLPDSFVRRAQQMAVSDVKVELLPRSL
jgi:primosomal protein N'